MAVFTYLRVEMVPTPSGAVRKHLCFTEPNLVWAISMLRIWVINEFIVYTYFVIFRPLNQSQSLQSKLGSVVKYDWKILTNFQRDSCLGTEDI